MLSLTVAKFLTALVSFATAITLLTLIPQLLRLKVRENLLRIKANELDREVWLMKRKEVASWHVRMLTQEIRKSLDRHTILYTTLIELSKTLELENCAVWMPNDGKTMMNLTHPLRQLDFPHAHQLAVPIDDSDVQRIIETEGVVILNPESLLACRSSGAPSGPGAVAAIRMPMLKVSNFKGGTPEMVPACYAILVLVLPRDDSRIWSYQEQEIVEVVADQVAVALSHAAILEESQLMRDKLSERNRFLQQARTNAMMASEARNSFQNVMSQGMRRPIHSITSLLSILQQESLDAEQKLIVDTMAKTNSVITTLISDIMDSPAASSETLSLEIRPFKLHYMVRAVACVAKSLCISKGFGFDIQVANGLPDCVFGDEKRIIQVLMHMVTSLLSTVEEGSLTFLVLSERGMVDKPDQRLLPWKENLSDGHAILKFEISIKSNQSGASTSTQLSRISISEGAEVALSFNMCKKLVQMMQGNLWQIPNSQGLAESMALLLHFQLKPNMPVSDIEESPNFNLFNSQFKGLKVLLADEDSINRAVTRKLLEKLGCHVLSVSSAIECLSSMSGSGTLFDLVILDVHAPRSDGFEVALRIKKFRSGPWPLVVAMTANTDEDVWERCLQSGIVGVIQKPITLQGIVDELRRVFRKT